GAALMGTGQGRGENRAMEAAQQAISSPLLDNISIAGATGVLINITGGEDMTLGEVTQISEAIHDAAGDEAEIIFGTGKCGSRSLRRDSTRPGRWRMRWRVCSGPPPVCCRSAIAGLGRRRCRRR